MPNKAHAELLQVVGGQLGQYRGIDGVVAERLLVLLQPETVEPCPNIHALLPAAVTAARAYRTRIVGMREYSTWLISAHSRAAHHAAIARVTGPSGGRAPRRAAKLTRPSRVLVTSALGLGRVKTIQHEP